MLVYSFVLLLVWLFFSLFYSFQYFISILFMSFIFLFFVLGGFSSFLCSIFVSFYGYYSMVGLLLSGLSVWVSMLMFLVSVKNNRFFFSFVVVSLLSIVVFFFYTSNLLMFYILFEFSLIPTVYLVVKWGYQPERLQAGLYFVIYTITSSLPLLFSVIFFYSFSFSYLLFFSFPFYCFSSSPFSYLFFFSFSFAFLVKVPMWGVHLWLPKAHVEAPVTGSMVLAGVLLKLGGYGLMMIFPLSFFDFTWLFSFLLGLNLWGVIVVGFVCLCSVDMKSLVAYSSVIHMGLVILGIFSGSIVGLLGAVLMMLAHGFSSPGIFSLVNFNYEVSGTRSIVLQKGLGLFYPVMSFFWFLLLCANMSAPPSLSLISEILVSVSIVKLGSLLSIVVFFLTFISASYNMFLFSCQQGESSGFIGFSFGVDSSLILSSMLHLIPAFLSFFSVFYFYF